MLRHKLLCALSLSAPLALSTPTNAQVMVPVDFVNGGGTILDGCISYTADLVVNGPNFSTAAGSLAIGTNWESGMGRRGAEATVMMTFSAPVDIHIGANRDWPYRQGLKTTNANHDEGFTLRGLNADATINAQIDPSEYEVRARGDGSITVNAENGVAVTHNMATSISTVGGTRTAQIDMHTRRGGSINSGSRSIIGVFFTPAANSLDCDGDGTPVAVDDCPLTAAPGDAGCQPQDSRIANVAEDTRAATARANAQSVLDLAEDRQQAVLGRASSDDEAESVFDASGTWFNIRGRSYGDNSGSVTALVGRDFISDAQRTRGIAATVTQTRLVEGDAEADKTGLTVGLYNRHNHGDGTATSVFASVGGYATSVENSLGQTANYGSTMAQVSVRHEGARALESGATLKPYVGGSYMVERVEGFTYSDNGGSVAEETNASGTIRFGADYVLPRLASGLQLTFGGQVVQSFDLTSESEESTDTTSATFSVQADRQMGPRTRSATSLSVSGLGTDGLEAVEVSQKWERSF